MIGRLLTLPLRLPLAAVGAVFDRVFPVDASFDDYVSTTTPYARLDVDKVDGYRVAEGFDVGIYVDGQALARALGEGRR